MSKHEEADLILKLYDLRREATMRKARDWYFANFHPQSAQEYDALMYGENGAYARMVLSYWDMATALVNHGAISKELFAETAGECMAVYSRIAPILQGVRAEWGEQAAANMEKFVNSIPDGKEQIERMRERTKAVMARMSQRSTQAAAN